MCNFHLDIPAIERAHGIDVRVLFRGFTPGARRGTGRPRLRDTHARLDRGHRSGRLFVRNICMEFDAYLKGREGEKPIFSRTV